MTIKECIDNVDNIKPNQYSTKDKVLWLSFIDEIIINDVLKTHEGYDGRYDNFTGYSESKLSVPLIVSSPYDRLYTAYLKMKIDGENGETARYNNSAELFNTYMMEYRKYYNKTHMPLTTTEKNRHHLKPSNKSIGISGTELENLKRELYALLSEDFSNAISSDKLYDIVTSFVNNNIEMLKGKDGKDGADGKDGKDGKDGYTPRKGIDYQNVEGDSAYAIAVNNGFEGTETEWLASLRGEKGEKGEKGDQGIQGVPGKDGDAASRSLFANAITKSVSGTEEIVIRDVSPIEHTLKCKVSNNKELWPRLTPCQYVTVNDDGTFNIQSEHGFACECDSLVLPAGTYTTSGSTYTYVWITGLNVQYNTPTTFTLEEETTINIGVTANEAIEVKNQYFRLEEGTVATPYITDFSAVGVSVYGEDGLKQTVTANADGSVDGILSVAPVMSLMCSANGVNMDVEYIADTKNYVDSVEEKLENCVPIMLNNEATQALPKLYAQDSKAATNEPYLYPCDRTDGYMEHFDDGGANAVYTEFARCVAIRNENGNLLSDLPTRKNEVANKLYVDTAIGDIDNALDGIIAIQNSLIGGEGV